MSDFPAVRRHKTHISSYSRECVGLQWGMGGFGNPSSVAWPNANRAFYLPLTITTPFLVQKVFWANGATASGNVDCGIYSMTGKQLASSGSTAQSGTTTVQSVALGTPLLLTPGGYMMALAASSGATTIYRVLGFGATAHLMLFGMLQQDTAFPLPATASYASSIGAQYLPLFGIASTTLV